MLCVRMRGRRSIQRHHQITRARAIKRQVVAARGVTTLHIGDLSSFLRLRVRGGLSIAPSGAVLDGKKEMSTGIEKVPAPPQDDCFPLPPPPS